MHKLPVTYPDPPGQQPAGPVIRALRLVGRIFAWSVAFGAVLITWALLRK
jgi:hypothetical protein